MRLLLLGEHVLLLQGLVKLLHDQTGADIRFFTRMEEADALAAGWSPDVLIVETSDVAAATERIARVRGLVEGVPLVVIAPGEPAQFLAALRAGVRGFVGRDATSDQLLGCIEAVRRGEWGVPRTLIGALVDAYLGALAARGAAQPVHLTEREQSVLLLLSRGASTQRIGRELFLSESTVRAEIRALTQKLGVANRVQLVTEALRLGLAEPD